MTIDVALEHLEPLSPTCPAWEPLRAAGCTSSPADDSRRVWPLLSGWTKLTIPFDHPNPEGGEIYNNTLFGWQKLPFPPKGEITVHRDQELPDQWSVARDYHVAWYAMELDLSELDSDQLWFTCDAIAQVCTLYLNGQEVGHHVGGYTPFEINLTPALKEQENTLVIRVVDDTAVIDRDNQRITSMLDSGRGIHNAHHAGIRGGIYLEARQAVHLEHIRIRPSIRKQELKVETWLSDEHGDATIHHAVYEWPHGEKPVLSFSEDSVSWPDAKLWSPEQPHLYVLRTTIEHDGQAETVETRFGFREFWIEGRQFMLNGKPFRFHGSGEFPREMMSVVPEMARDYCRRNFAFLKEHFHYKSARFHATLHPGWVAQATDEAGVLVINQTGLVTSKRDWYRRGGETFLNNLRQQAAEWYWRDVNCPSVVIWDIENEWIRGQREQDFMDWTVGLNRVITDLDPEAIINHSGAAWYHPDQQLIHLHMSDNYSRPMREWQAHYDKPLVLGEFWMGGGGETRLPNSYEYSDRQDYHLEEARLYREKMLEMRYYGVSGIMPHRLTHWPLEKAGPILSREDAANLEQPYAWRFPKLRGDGGDGLVPVIAFAWPRTATVLEGEPFSRQIIVCNDSESDQQLDVRCTYGEQQHEWHLTLPPGDQARLDATFDPAESGVLHTSIDGEHDDELPIHPIPAPTAPTTQRRVVVVPPQDLAGFETADELPEDAANTLVIVPPRVADDAFGRNGRAVRRYLKAGGRMLVLAQEQEPLWLPTGLPFGSLARFTTEFERAGFENAEKDRIYSRAVPIYAQGHPALEPLAEGDFQEWSPIDGRVSDDIFVRPNAIGVRAAGPYRALLGATRREYTSLLECGIGQGTLMLCQAHVLRQWHHPAARALFYNLIRYLDGSAWQTDKKLALLGTATLDLAVTSPDEADVILASDGADPEQLRQLAEAGKTVLVLSCETASRLPGYAVQDGEGLYPSATRHGIVDHPLFWGIASGSFMPLEQTPAMGMLEQTPDGVDILLAGHAGGHSPLANDWSADIGFYGLETREAAPPIAVRETIGDGELIVTTLEPWDAQSETHRQLLYNLLGNAGIAIPPAEEQPTTIEVKRTIPIQLDGKLDDWINDIDDINLSEYVHAVPIALTSRDCTAGDIAEDRELSAIFYFLYDEDSLYAGGMVFSSSDAVRLEMEIDDHQLTIELESATFAIDGNDVAEPKLAIGRQSIGEVLDTRLLNLADHDNRTGKRTINPGMEGQTFELAIPWQELAKRPDALRLRLRLIRDGVAILQQPLPEDDHDHLNLQLETTAAPTFYKQNL